MRVLFIINECNPEWSSVPLLGYHFYDAVSQYADVTLVTHARNRQALEKVRGRRCIHYIPESRVAVLYYQVLTRHVFSRWGNWPLHHVLSYPVYAEFNHRVSRQFSKPVKAGAFDIVHALTPILPRYPYKISRACAGTPLVVGPVNGGLPSPAAFSGIARKEAAYFNFMRRFSRLLPDFSSTYLGAAKVLAGSSHTHALLGEMFPSLGPRLELFFENGISPAFFATNRAAVGHGRQGPFRLLFVGRLVPYKGTDMLIAALGAMAPGQRARLTLTIVGDGPERARLEAQVRAQGLGGQVRFAGWVDQAGTAAYYRDADCFCFPSIREFGGAVVLEAMAAGLPCIVAHHGGIGEYVTDETGIRIVPLSREHIVETLRTSIETLMNDAILRGKFRRNALRRAAAFAWDEKAKKILDIYHQVVAGR